jgi:hypothetical protein
MTSATLTPATSAATSLGSALFAIGASIPQVRKIFSSKHGDVVSVWTFIEGFDGAVRKRIYSAEQQLFESYPTFKFDFHVIEGDEHANVSEAEVVYPN